MEKHDVIEFAVFSGGLLLLIVISLIIGMV